MDFQHLSHVEIRQICYFIALVQSDNNVTEAARRLGIKKPPLTQRIQALEAWLSADLKMFDVKLFDRSKRPMVLTAAGTVFLAEAQQALMHLDRAVFQIRQASQGHIGRLVIGMTTVIANSILPDVVQAFPNVVLELREVTVEQQIQLLRTHQIDVIRLQPIYFTKGVYLEFL